jgi:CheY-like chemotaxis protein
MPISTAEERGSAMPSNMPVMVTPLSGVRILLVEDDDDSRELLALLLMLNGASVEAALAALDRAGPDAIVSDIGLPGANGYSLIRKVRALESARGRFTPAVAVTAFARPEDRAEAFDAGFQAHLAKPIDADRLVAILAELIAGRRPSGSPGAPARG